MKAAPALFWHTLPLHYLPHLLTTECLYSQDELKQKKLPIRPRRTAERRDRKLRLSRFVHLSFTPQTPLLADKLTKGYPHALLAFDKALLEESNSAVVKFNAKSWRHRDDFAPIYDSEAKARVIEEWRQGRYPSAELLIEKVLPLSPNCLSLHLASEEERIWLCGLVEGLKLMLPIPVSVSPSLFPEDIAINLSPHRTYAEECLAARSLLPPPNLPFD
jgi:hypothetical protein